MTFLGALTAFWTETESLEVEDRSTGGVREAVHFSANSLEGLEVQSNVALSALEAPFVVEFLTRRDFLEGVDGLLADSALRVRHYVKMSSLLFRTQEHKKKKRVSALRAKMPHERCEPAKLFCMSFPLIKFLYFFLQPFFLKLGYN